MAALCVSPTNAQSFGRLAPKAYKNGSVVRSAFREVVALSRAATVRVFCNGKVKALGTVIEDDGWILTKASELSEPIRCRLSDDRELDARLINVDVEHDLALLKVEAEGLTTVRWADKLDVNVGQWLAIPGAKKDPLAVGVVSVAAREIPRQRAMLGIGLDDAENGVRVSQVIPLSAAAKAGVKVDDVITHLDETPIDGRAELIDIVGQHRSGDVVHLRVLRGEGEEPLNVEATLGIWGLIEDDMPSFVTGGISRRRHGFPSVFQHDSVLRPSQCGGPVVNLQGQVVGINIARAGRTASYALPSTVVVPLLEELKSGRLARGEDSRPVEETSTEM